MQIIIQALVRGNVSAEYQGFEGSRVHVTAGPHSTRAVFLEPGTSRGNYQAWVALPEGTDNDFARRLCGWPEADDRAGGATRIAGSLNSTSTRAWAWSRHRPGISAFELRAYAILTAQNAAAESRA
jgi:hypothetical protein